jgi:hypothetical protein
VSVFSKVIIGEIKKLGPYGNAAIFLYGGLCSGGAISLGEAAGLPMPISFGIGFFLAFAFSSLFAFRHDALVDLRAGEAAVVFGHKDLRFLACGGKEDIMGSPKAMVALSIATRLSHDKEFARSIRDWALQNGIIEEAPDLKEDKP